MLFCAWLAWSRFRVVVPLRDKTLASVVIGLDRTLRAVGGVPTYALTDNEKTVTVEHVCGIAVRNATIVEVSRHYGLTIPTCEPADPQSKGGSEATVKIAKADLVPTDHNLRDEYADWQALERACAAVHGGCQHAAAPRNASAAGDPARPRARASAPAAAAAAHAVLRADPQGRPPSDVSVGDAIYSVPHELIGERVWVRAEGEQLVVVHIDQLQGPREVARHRLTTPGRPSINDEHYPPRPAGALERKPRARSSEEREFLQIGEGAERWLKRAAAEGTHGSGARWPKRSIWPSCTAPGRSTTRWRGAPATAGSPTVTWPASSPTSRSATVIPLPQRAPEERSLQRSTRSWEGFGR